MRLITSISRGVGRDRLPRATLPWAEIEAEAARQGCTVADVLFDRAGRPATVVPTVQTTLTPPSDPIGARAARRVIRTLRRFPANTTHVNRIQR